MTTQEIQQRGMRTLARLRTANGEYAGQLMTDLAWLDALLTARVLEGKR